MYEAVNWILWDLAKTWFNDHNHNHHHHKETWCQWDFSCTRPHRCWVSSQRREAVRYRGLWSGNLVLENKFSILVLALERNFCFLKKDLWPIITIHPSKSPLIIALQRLERHQMTLVKQGLNELKRTKTERQKDRKTEDPAEKGSLHD